MLLCAYQICVCASERHMSDARYGLTATIRELCVMQQHLIHPSLPGNLVLGYYFTTTCYLTRTPLNLAWRTLMKIPSKDSRFLCFLRSPKGLGCPITMYERPLTVFHPAFCFDLPLPLPRILQRMVVQSTTSLPNCTTTHIPASPDTL